MSRPSLAELGLHLPPLAVTSAGPLPVTGALREAQRAHARAALSDAELAEETRRACEYWIAVQERLGMDVLVDGDLDGRDLVCRFTDGLGGFTPGGLVRLYGDRYRRKPIVAGPVSWREPISVDRWRAIQSLTARPLKARVTGPYTLMRWSFDTHYPSRDAACLAIATALRQELNALVAAGARVIQLDEPALAYPEADWGLAAEALRLVTTGVGAYVIAHTGGGAGMASTAGPRPALPVDNLDLPSLGEPDSLPPGVHATVDVFAPGSNEAAAAAVIREHLQAAVATYGAERLWVTSSWSLGHVTLDRAEAHLEDVVRAAADARGVASAPAVTTPVPSLDTPVTPATARTGVAPAAASMSHTPEPAAVDADATPAAPSQAVAEPAPEGSDEGPPESADGDPTGGR